MRYTVRACCLTTAALTIGLCTVGNQVAHAAPRAVSYQPTAPVTVARAALAAFNAQNCAAIYGLTAPWVRGSLPRAATIAACARGFADDRAQGIQSLRLTLDGHGRYVSTGVYRQPLLAQEATQGSTRTVHETMQLVHMRGQWYVLATW